MLGSKTGIACFFVWCALCAQCCKGQAQTPESVLSSLKKLDRRLLQVAGSLPTDNGTDGWQLYVNDALVYDSIQNRNVPVHHFRFVVELREGDNLISLSSFKMVESKPVQLHRWSTHISSPAAHTPERFALLIDGESNSNQILSNFKAQLEDKGIAPHNVFTVDTAAELQETANELARRTSGDDSVLVYYIGKGLVPLSGGEPILSLSSDTPAKQDLWLSLSGVIRLTEGLPNPAFMFDTDFREYVRDPSGGITLESRSPDGNLGLRRSSTQWLSGLPRQNNLEFAITNPYMGGTPPGYLTRLLRTQIDSCVGDCNSFADIFKDLKHGTSADTSPPVLYYNSRPSGRGFSLGIPIEQPNSFSVSVSPVHSIDPTMIVYDLAPKIPSNVSYSWADLFVDGILIRHLIRDVQRPNFVWQLPLSEGTHLVDIKLGTGSRIVGSTRTEIAVNMNQPTVRADFDNSIAVSISNPDHNTSTTGSYSTLEYLIGGPHSQLLYYSVRNNGAVVWRGYALPKRKKRLVEITTQVPLNVGINYITVEVNDGKHVQTAKVFVEKRNVQPIRAVVIGVDQVGGLPKLKGVLSDVQSITRMLLFNTDLKARDLTVLTGHEATTEAIRRILRAAPTNTPTDPFLQEPPNDTLFLYFAGYGTTLLDRSNRPTGRCILPSDFRIESEQATCISTDEIDRYLDSWPKAIVLFDTSYDGLSIPSGPDSQFVSRTFKDFLSNDPSWRTTSGVDRTGKLFLVASDTNNQALELTSPAGGLFTGSFVDAVEKGTSSGPLRLQDAFVATRILTRQRSGESEVPLLKGSLPSPFMFRSRFYEELTEEADEIVRNLRTDSAGLRPINTVQANRALDLVDTALAMAESRDAKFIRANILLEENELDSAQQSIAEGLRGLDEAIHLHPFEYSRWMLSRCVLKERQGDVEGAISDCQSALSAAALNIQSFLSARVVPRAQLTLVGLYFAAGQYSKCISIAKQVFGLTRAELVDISDEELAHAALFAYLALRLDGRSKEASNFLNLYSAKVKSRDVINVSVVLFNVALNLNRLSPPEFNSGWFDVVVDYFNDSKADADIFDRFYVDTLAFDRKDASSYECIRRFVTGMRLWFDKSPTAASNEFQMATLVERHQLLEYWVARNPPTPLH